jgi:glutamate synthase (NADPH/NADH) small chain
MGDPKGFLTYKRELPVSRSVSARIEDYKEIKEAFSKDKTVEQAARCMDCGVPFCHNGCPLGNVIPEFNDAAYEEDWKQAFEILNSTNNFPEFTGRICPAPCEQACVLNINQEPVAIEQIEKEIAEVAFEQGYIRPQPPSLRSGKKVAVVGSGPAGLAAAAELNKAGHLVTVFERKDRVGGLLRYGIPDFKLEKWVIERRIALMEAEGIRFRVNADVGNNVAPAELMEAYDAVVLCGGSTIPRDLPVPGRSLNGVHFAMDFLEQSNRRVAQIPLKKTAAILATGKDVVVIGGGDTGADCVGTSNRQKANSVTQIELLARPPQEKDPLSWPNWPMILQTSSSHEEGCERQWAILTKAFKGDQKGQLRALEIVDIEWTRNAQSGKFEFQEIEGTLREIPCQLALLSIGFLHPQFEGLLDKLGVEVNDRGNVKDDNYQTNIEKVFVAGDMRRGQSLVVWAIAEGRKAAEAVDNFLTEATVWPASKLEA